MNVTAKRVARVIGSSRGGPRRGRRASAIFSSTSHEWESGCVMAYGERFEDALIFAARMHRQQNARNRHSLRHAPLRSQRSLAKMAPDEDTAIAALA